MAQKIHFSPTALRQTGAYDQTARKRHAHDRDEQRLKREERREAQLILLHPALFEQAYGVAA